MEMLRVCVETLKMDGGSAWMEVAVVPHMQRDESKVNGSLTLDR